MHREKSWPHAPTHRLSESGTYFVTGATYRKAHHFREPLRLGVLERGLLKLAAEHGWQFEAWAVFLESLPFRRPLAGERRGIAGGDA